jgi:uncharacterized membrane protein (DUF4010 family)
VEPAGLELLHRLGVALAIGLLVGAERHWRERDEPSGKRTAGVRTFGLTGLVGGIAAAVADALPGPGDAGAALLLGAAFLGHAGAMVLFKLREAAAEGRFSVTTVVAAEATFLLGALAVLGDMRVAGGAAVAMAALLAARESLHRFLARLSWAELRSALLLLAMTLVALPLVPDAPIPGLPGLNPARVWRLAVILAAVSFAGYVAIRLFGAGAGHALAGAAAGLVSSTAATSANARASAAGGDDVPLLAAGALVAGAVSFLRTAALAWIGSPVVGELLVPALLAGALAQGAVAAAMLLRRAAGGGPGAGPPGGIGNPFELGAVLKLAALLAAVGLVAELASARFGGAGAMAVAALTGLADVDAITLTVPALVPDRLAAPVAAATVAVAVASNGLAKCAYALALGGGGFGWRFVGGTLLGLLLAGVTLALWA